MNINPKQKINHPLANYISVQNDALHYATPGKSNELAFFMGTTWVTKVIPEFSKYAHGEEGDTLVYGWVPNELVNEFMSKYGV
jgi:hypothetical protein